jgi:YceI-like domain
LGANYAAAQTSGGRVFKLNPQASEVRIFVFRGGRAAKVGHNHVLSAPRFTGFVEAPPPGAGGGRFDLEFRLDQLEIDDPAQRATLGGAFSTKVSPDAVADTREHMLGDANLQASRFPFVRIHSLQVTGEVPRLAAKVQVEMHGQQRELWIPISVEGLPDRIVASGAFVLRQSDFGVKPYSILGGVVSVEDEVVIEFKLVGA